MPATSRHFSELDRGNARAPVMDITAENLGMRQRLHQ
jgi:hypothetical protein